MNTEFQNLPNVLSPKEVQTYFGISRSTTYRIFHDATFPAFHIGNRLLVRRDELLGKGKKYRRLLRCNNL